MHKPRERLATPASLLCLMLSLNILQRRLSTMSVGTWFVFHTPYNEAEVRKCVPKSAGIYTLWVKYKNGSWECFYVGKADDLEGRLLDHLSADEPNSCIKGNVKSTCGVSWIEIVT